MQPNGRYLYDDGWDDRRVFDALSGHIKDIGALISYRREHWGYLVEEDRSANRSEAQQRRYLEQGAWRDAVREINARIANVEQIERNALSAYNRLVARVAELEARYEEVATRP